MHLAFTVFPKKKGCEKLALPNWTLRSGSLKLVVSEKGKRMGRKISKLNGMSMLISLTTDAKWRAALVVTVCDWTSSPPCRLTRLSQLPHVVLIEGIYVVQLLDKCFDNQLGVVHKAMMLNLVAVEIKGHRLQSVHKSEEFHFACN